MESSNLFKGLVVGKAQLSHRLVLLPTTRFRNSKTNVPTDASLKFYTDRSRTPQSLLVTEATLVSPKYGVYPHAPGIWSDEQVIGWKQVVDGVHANKSYISMQLWALGRVAPAKVAKTLGYDLYAPSAIHYSVEAAKDAEKNGVALRELSTEDVKQFVENYLVGADNAFKAGVDMVEIHAANGYLINQFLDENSNKREDQYGGSVENRARVLLEIVDVIGSKHGYDRVAVRLSPWSVFQNMSGFNARVNPKVTYGYFLSEFERRAQEGKRLAYVSMVEPVTPEFELLESDVMEYANNDFVSGIWRGNTLRGGGYFRDSKYTKMLNDVNANNRTLIGSATQFTSNPDLVERVRKGQPLSAYQRDLFYAYGNYGYNTFRDAGLEPLGPDSVLAQKPVSQLV